MNDNGIVFNQNAKKIAFDDEHHELLTNTWWDIIRDLMIKSVKLSKGCAILPQECWTRTAVSVIPRSAST